MNAEIKYLTSNRSKWLLYLVLFLCGVLVSTLMISSGNSQGWYGLVVFTIFALIFILLMLPGSSYLRLDVEGFIVCSLFRKHSYRWQDVDQFKVGSIWLNKMVFFNFSFNFKVPGILHRISSAISGYEAALPDTYGMRAEELAALMNEFKFKYSG